MCTAQAVRVCACVHPCAYFMHIIFLSNGLAVEQFAEIEDSLCVGQTLGADERVVLFLKLSPGQQ